MEVVLDSSFIVSCVKRNIDFVGKLRGLGFKVLLPREVMQEIKDLKLKTKAREDKVAVELALQILNENKDIKKMTIGTGRVDNELIKLGKAGAYVATLDNFIRRSVPNRVVINNAKNNIEVERD